MPVFTGRRWCSLRPYERTLVGTLSRHFEDGYKRQSKLRYREIRSIASRLTTTKKETCEQWKSRKARQVEDFVQAPTSMLGIYRRLGSKQHDEVVRAIGWSRPGGQVQISKVRRERAGNGMGGED